MEDKSRAAPIVPKRPKPAPKNDDLDDLDDMMGGGDIGALGGGFGGNDDEDEERKIKDFCKQEMLENYKVAIDKLDFMKKENDEQLSIVEDLERRNDEGQKMKENLGKAKF